MLESVEARGSMSCCQVGFSFVTAFHLRQMASATSSHRYLMFRPHVVSDRTCMSDQTACHLVSHLSKARSSIDMRFMA